MLSWVKQTRLGEFNLIYCRLTSIFNYWVTKRTNIKTLGGIHPSSFPGLSFTPDTCLPHLCQHDRLHWVPSVRQDVVQGVGVKFFCRSLILFSSAVVWVLHGLLSLWQSPAPGQSIFPSLPLFPLPPLTLFSHALFGSSSSSVLLCPFSNIFSLKHPTLV